MLARRNILTESKAFQAF